LFRYLFVNLQKKKKDTMFTTFCIGCMLSFAGGILYCAASGGSDKETLPNKMKDGRDFSEWYMELCEKNRKNNESRLEEIRYEKWLIEHNQC